MSGIHLPQQLTEAGIARRLHYSPPPPPLPATTPDLLTPAEVALLFRVNPKTVTRWDQQGRLHSIRTPGNHRRYYEAEMLWLLAGRPQLTGEQFEALKRGELT